MRYIIVILLMLCTGCASGVMPDWEGAMSGQDRRPVVIWTTDHGSDLVYAVARNEDAGTYSVNQIDTGMLPGQWTPQRCGLAIDSAGKAYWVQVEVTSNDLEIFANAGTGYQFDASWALLDDDASQNWTAIDIESRQNYIWGFAGFAGALQMFCIDLTAGVPAWTGVLNIVAVDNEHYSMVLNNLIQGHIFLVALDTGAVGYSYVPIYLQVGTSTITPFGVGTDYPQAIGCFGEMIFSTAGNILYCNPDVSYFPSSTSGETVYTATTLTSAYHAAYDPYRNCIHVVLIDYEVEFPNYTFSLKFSSRNANGWKPWVTVDSWTLPALAGVAITQTNRLFPQITVQPDGLVINNLEYNGTNSDGELHQFWLANAYFNDPAAGNWVHTADIAPAVNLFGLCAPEFWPAK